LISGCYLAFHLFFSCRKKKSTVQVDDSFDRLSDKFTGAPPKIQLCSKYERHTDHRTYVERKVLFEEIAKEVPPPELIRVGGKSGGGEEGGEEAAEEAGGDE